MITKSGKVRLDIGAWLRGEDDDIISTGFVKIEVNRFDMSIGLKAVLLLALRKAYDLLTFTPIGFGVLHLELR